MDDKRLEIFCEIIKSDQFLRIDSPNDIETYAEYLSYKVLKSLYEIVNMADKASWKECMVSLQSSQRLRDAAKAVVRYSIENFISRKGYDFHVSGTVRLLEDQEPGWRNGNLLAVKLYSEQEGAQIVEYFFLQAEIMYFLSLKADRADYHWEDFLEGLKAEPSLWDTLCRAFADALKRIDFKDGWMADDLEAVRFLHEPVPEPDEEP